MSPEADARLRTRDAIALGLLHGPAELLPISSSGHTTLVPWLLGWPYTELDPNLRKAFDVALHAGTTAAVLVGLRGEVVAELRALDRGAARRLALSVVPPTLATLAFERVIEERLGTPRSIATGLWAGGVAMAVADVAGGQNRRREDATDLDALALGVAQACALWPGVSRAGATLTVTRARGFARRDASILSRHAALPLIAGGSVFKAGRLVQRGGLPPGGARSFAAGTGAAFAATLASIKLVTLLERDRSLVPYAAYRIALAALVRRRLRTARSPATEASHEIHPASDVSPPRAAAQ